MTTNKQTDAPINGEQNSNGTAYLEGHVPLGSDAPENPLSDREMEVARLLVTGATNGEIARVLVISPHTVKVHLRNVFDKLQVSSRTEASMLLVKRGWVVVPGVEVSDGEAPSGESESLPEVEPLPNVEAQPRPWQFGIVIAALAVALITLLVPSWITTQKSTLALLSDSGQTILGKPVLNNLPYRWEVHPSLSQPRSRMATVEVDGQLYVVGGEGEQGAPLDLVEIYDLPSKAWRQGAKLPAPRANLAMAINGGELLIAGGSHSDTAGKAGAANEIGSETLLYDDIVRYDRAKDEWSAGGKLPLALAGAALAVNGDSLYLMGGWDGEKMQDGVWQLPLEKVGTATPEDWMVLTHLPNPVGWFGAVMVNDLLYVVGGYDGHHELAEFAAYHLPSGEWRNLAPLTTPRGGVSLVYDGITLLALGGGWDGTIQNHERYDALTNQWTTIASPISGEWRHFGAAANDGSVYILGGWSGAYLDSTLQFQSTFRALLPAIPNLSDDK